MANFQKSDRAKWVVTAIVFVLILVILGGLLYSVISGTSPQDWFEQDTSSGTVDDTQTPENGGEDLPDNSGAETPDNGGNVVEDGGEDVPDVEPVSAYVNYNVPVYYYVEV